MKRNYKLLLATCLFVCCWALLGQTSWTYTYAKPQINEQHDRGYSALNSNMSQVSPTATAPLTPTATADVSWLQLRPLPADSTDADIGQEIYIVVCQDCHGDEGQGLTDDWRAKWDPEHQNCWQSKCHDLAHPIEGFVMPRYVPAVMGEWALARFETASDLHTFISEKMPWYDPGSLTDEENWQITLFLLRENGIYSENMPLERRDAATFRLRELPAETATPAFSADTTSSPNSSTPANGRLWWLIIAFAIIPFVMIITVGIVFWMRLEE